MTAQKTLNYRAFYVGSNGSFLNSEHLDCVSDAEAIAAASRLTELYDIELWRGADRITRLERALAD